MTMQKPLKPLTDEEFAELKLRATICPGQCGEWRKPENVVWQKLHAAANEARSRVSKAYAQMDEVDRNADLSPDDKYRQRVTTADDAIADFEASKTLMRAREAVRCDASPAMLKALEQAEVGWERAMNMIAERAGRTKVSRYLAMVPSPLLRG
jgi:hypothetical protein